MKSSPDNSKHGTKQMDKGGQYFGNSFLSLLSDCFHVFNLQILQMQRFITSLEIRGSKSLKLLPSFPNATKTLVTCTTCLCSLSPPLLKTNHQHNTGGGSMAAREVVSIGF